jgi:hypothetical protein
MHDMFRLLIGVTAAASLACFLTGPLAAQDSPSYAQPLGNARLSGTVVRFEPGSYDLGLLDDRGFVDRIALHHGTIIEPVGIDLAPGMRVSVVGYDAGPSFVANEIARDDRPTRPAWYDRWVAPHAAGAQNPPAPPIVTGSPDGSRP